MLHAIFQPSGSRFFLSDFTGGDPLNIYLWVENYIDQSFFLGGLRRTEKNIFDSIKVGLNLY